MTQIKSEIISILKEGLQKLGLNAEVIHLEHPENFTFGDFSTNIAMVLAKESGKSPRSLAEEIISFLPQNDYVERVEVAGAGFINFYLSKKFFLEVVKSIDEDYGKQRVYEGKKILIEHSSPNLFKPFHIGHMMNNAIGESISRLAEYSGAKVSKISYPSDISLGIAKAVWDLKRRGGMAYLEKQKGDLNKDLMTLLGDAYAEGNKAFEGSPDVAREIREVYKKIVSDGSSEEFFIYKFGKDLNLSYFQHVAHRLGSHFDAFVFESEAGEIGKEIVEKNTPKVFTVSDGATIYEGEKAGLHTRVFINKEGFPTYEAKDIGLLSIKFDRYNPDISIFITDAQQAEYFKVVGAAAGEIDINWKEKTVHRTHGRMSFKGMKMSSRLGGVPLATSLLEEVSERALEKMTDKDALLAEKIAISAIKFSILKSEAGKNINFDPATSLSFEGDSGPYLQYTFARCHSLLEKAMREGVPMEHLPKNMKSYVPSDLEKIIYKFPDVVLGAISAWAPHQVASYLLELSRGFNSWYGKTRVVDKDNENAGFNLFLVEKTAQIIKNGLYLLGVDTPERM